MSIAKPLLLLAFIAALFFTGCKDDDFNESPNFRLAFSTDSVQFDTVFATVGSATQILKVYNRDDSPVNIANVRLANDPNNSYRINVDGLSGEEISNIEIGGNDSIFIFIEVTVEPNANQLYPFVEGEIQFTTNGVTQAVKLVAWGWDAIFYVPTIFPSNGLPDFSVISDDEFAEVTWTTEKPIVVYGYVVVDSTQTLTIEPGTQVFFHQNSGLWVYREGRISAVGTLDQPIVFQGDRLESFYDEQPGQWDRIWIHEGSEDNRFEHVLIKNGFIGIQAETAPFAYNINAGLSENTLSLKNVVIRNQSVAGLYSRNYKLEGENVLISSCGQYLLAGTGAGQYNFTHCTFANNWRYGLRQTPSLSIGNQVQLDETTLAVYEVAPSLFRNCIFVGNGLNETEFQFDTSQVDVHLTFEHTLLQGEEEIMTEYLPFYFGNGTVIATNSGFDVGFTDFVNGDFSLRDENAWAIGKGMILDEPELDIVGTLYNSSSRPMGCYEFLPE